MIHIESLNVDYNGGFIITDIDDCLIYTSKQLLKLGINAKQFFFNDDVYTKNKEKVMINAELTKWGEELTKLIKSGEIRKVILMSAAKNRGEIIKDRLCLPNTVIILENMNYKNKADYLNSLTNKVLYVDDKTNVINQLRNRNIRSVVFPNLRSDHTTRKFISRRALSRIKR